MNKINEITAWMDANKMASKTEFEAKKKEFEGIVYPIMAKF